VDMDVQALARNGAAGVTVQCMTLSGGISARRTPELALRRQRRCHPDRP
jgi:hypothetical protein